MNHINPEIGCKLKKPMEFVDKARITLKPSFFGFILYFLLIQICAIHPAIAADKQQVLLLYSFNDVLPWQKSLRKGMHTRLKAVGNQAVLFEERLDSARLNPDSSEKLFSEYLSKKYADVKLDLVIAESTAASEFLVQNPGLFGQVKRYLLNPGHLRSVPNTENVIAVRDEFKQNLDLALTLSPQARHLVFVSNLEPTTAGVVEKIWQKHFSKRVSFVAWSEDFSFEELYHRAEQLSQDTIILFAPVNHDRTGAKAVPYDVLQQLAARASVPVYTTHDTLMGSGAVGGYLMSSERTGYLMADLIAGISPNEIPNRTFFANLFDMRALKRWGIPQSRLPLKSEIQFQSVSFFKKHQTVILYAVPIVLIETMILIALVQALRTRRRALNALDEEHKLLELKVTERTHELAQSEKRYRSLFEGNSDAIMLLDDKGFFDCNKAALTLFDCPDVAAFTKLRPSDLSPPQQPDGRSSKLVDDHYIAKAMRDGKAFFEWRHWRYTDHLEFDADVLLNALELGDHKVIQAVVRDITERKQFEQELHQAKELADRANKAKSEFLSSMSHELRTPLNAVLGYSQMLELDASLNKKQKNSISNIYKAGTHLLELINQVLDLSKIESGHIELSIEPVAIDELVDKCFSLIKPLAVKKGIQLERNERSGYVVNADRLRTKQVLFNLLSNAIKYNRDKGKVRLEVLCVDSNLRITVIDTGPGIEKYNIKKLFQPFDRLDAEASNIEGTGVGLSIARTLVNLMNGKIGLESSVGTGSRFWIELPLVSDQNSKEPANKETQPQQSPAASQKQHLILYIEDNVENLNLVGEILSLRPSFKLISAETAEGGIELAKSNPPDIILLDINLPGIDGFSALKILQRDPQLTRIPVIAITAAAMEQDIKRGLDAGFVEYMTKPLDIPHFLRTLDMYTKTASKRPVVL